MSDKSIAILRKRTQSGILKQARLFNVQEGQEADEADLVGDFPGRKYLGTSDEHTPEFDADNGKWYFKGTHDDLTNFVKELGLTHAKGPKKGQLIKPEEVNLHNAADPFFNHPEFRKLDEGGMLRMDQSNPVIRFLYACSMGKDSVWAYNNSNPAEKADAVYEIVDPKQELKEQTDKIDFEVEAITLYGSMPHDKLLRVTRALNHYKLSPRDDIKPEALKRTVYEYVIKQGANTTDNEGKTYLQKFVELGNMDPEELAIREVIAHCMKKGIISPRRDGKYYVFNSGETQDTMDGVSSVDDAVKYLRNPDNIEVLSFLNSKFAEKGKTE